MQIEESDRQPANVSNVSTLDRLSQKSESDRHAAEQRAEARRRAAQEHEEAKPALQPANKELVHKRILETNLF